MATPDLPPPLPQAPKLLDRLRPARQAAAPAAPQSPKLLDRLRTALLIRGTKPEVAEAQLGWVRSFIHFHKLRHPETMGEGEIGAFLTHLEVERYVPLAQQAQARQALRFLYREFSHRELGPIPVQYTPAGTCPAARRRVPCEHLPILVEKASERTFSRSQP